MALLRAIKVMKTQVGRKWGRLSACGGLLARLAVTLQSVFNGAVSNAVSNTFNNFRFAPHIVLQLLRTRPLI
jgi:hypothetical protein